MSGSAIPPDVIAQAVAAARAWLRGDAGVEDGTLPGLATTAILLAEAYLGTALIVRPFEDVVGTGGGWRPLRAVPVRSIAGLTGLPADGAPVVLAVDAYGIDIDAEGRGWVRVTVAGAAGRAAVSYSAGLATSWAAVPAPIAQGVAMLVAHLFARGDGDAAPPAAVAALWRPYRRMRIGSEVRR